MKLKVFAILLCLMLVTSGMAQDSDRPYEGITLNSLLFSSDLY